MALFPFNQVQVWLLSLVSENIQLDRMFEFNIYILSFFVDFLFDIDNQTFLCSKGSAVLVVFFLIQAAEVLKACITTNFITQSLPVVDILQ